ncbi:hypothetical protein P7K49_031464, partial [Saguinus oedipus]
TLDGYKQVCQPVGTTAPGTLQYICDKLGTDKCDNSSMSQMGYTQGASQSGQVL